MEYRFTLDFVRGKKNKGNARNISGIPEESFVKKVTAYSEKNVCILRSYKFSAEDSYTYLSKYISQVSKTLNSLN